MIYYLLAILDNINAFLFILFIFGLFVVGVFFVALLANAAADEDVEDILKDLKKWTWIAVFLGILNCLMPNQKQAAFIIVAPAIVENKDVQETVKNIPELTKLGTEYLMEMLKNETKANVK